MSKRESSWHQNLNQPKTGSQFPGGPRRPVRGTYDEIPPSARWRWNARDTASTSATMAVFQPALVPMSYVLDNVATSMMPALPATIVGLDVGFWAALAGQTLVVGLIKGLSNLLRHHGSSLMKDLFAWLSLMIGDLIRASVMSAALDWLPWRRRRRFPRVPDHSPPAPPSTGPVRRWLRNRRRLF